MKLDENDKAIIKELIRDPRLSDNQVSRITSIAVKTVNRKRKRLEQANVLNYHLYVNNGLDGTNSFNGIAQFMVIFRHGVTRKSFLDNLARVGFSPHDIKHIKYAFLGEEDGHLSLTLVIESRAQEDLLEIFNSELTPKLQSMLGYDCIKQTRVTYLHSILVQSHNYLPMFNISKGKMKKEWPTENIFTF